MIIQENDMMILVFMFIPMYADWEILFIPTWLYMTIRWRALVVVKVKKKYFVCAKSKRVKKKELFTH